MQRIHCPGGCWFFAALLACFSFAPAASAQPDGPSILAEFAARHQVPFEMEQLTIRLMSGDTLEEQREMRRYSRKLDNGEFRHLVVIDGPPLIAGVALLAWQRADKQDRYWSYLPAAGRTREQVLHSGGASSYFMGTDLTYEDIAAEDISKYEYERLPDQEIDGVKVFVIRAVPGNNEVARESGYLHRDLFLHRDNYALLRINYYDRRGKLIKRLSAQEAPVNIRDQAWRVDHFLLNNIRDRHQTELIVRKRELEEIAVPRHLFEAKNLARLSAIVKIRH